jgi:hypothetical protein
MCSHHAPDGKAWPLPACFGASIGSERDRKADKKKPTVKDECQGHRKRMLEAIAKVKLPDIQPLVELDIVKHIKYQIFMKGTGVHCLSGFWTPNIKSDHNRYVSEKWADINLDGTSNLPIQERSLAKKISRQFRLRSAEVNHPGSIILRYNGINTR